MLGKLLKNDFIGSAHAMLPVYLVALIAGAITALSYIFNIKFLKFIGSFSLVILVFGLVIITIFVMMNYFNKSLYSDQGYLSYTLPVKSRDLLFSKATVSFAWIAISYLILAGFVVGVLWYAKVKLNESLGGEIDEIINTIGSLVTTNGLPSVAAIAKIVAIVLLYGFVSILILVSQVFFSMTLSNVRGFNKLGFFGGIIIFAVLLVVMKIVSSLIMVYLPMSLFISGDGIKITLKSMADVSSTYGIGGFLFEAIASAGLLFATNHLMSKKINLR